MKDYASCIECKVCGGLVQLPTVRVAPSGGGMEVVAYVCEAQDTCPMAEVREAYASYVRQCAIAGFDHSKVSPKRMQEAIAAAAAPAQPVAAAVAEALGQVPEGCGGEGYYVRPDGSVEPCYEAGCH